MIKNILKHRFFLSIFGSVIVFSLVFLLILIFRYEENIEEDIFKISTTDIFQITQHKASYIKTILGSSQSYIDEVKSDSALRKQLEENVKNLLTDNIKYAYILYKDKNDVFRFLIDGSEDDEKSFLGQKFDIANNGWFDVYTTKEPVVIKHNILQKLSISYLVPIINKQNVELILAIDFSVDKISDINNIIVMMKTAVVLILLIIFLSLLTLVFQLFRYKHMKKSSFTDRLTNIYNRNYLHEIENSLELSEYILLVLDIDHFKGINDKYGHDAGDKILKELGLIFTNILRLDDDLAIRYGGEEFVLLIKTKSENSEIAIRIVERIFETIQNHKFYIDEEEYIQVTTSIGVNKRPDEQESFADAFKVADLALYEAKNSGRDKIIYSL
ncbi:GGDEF domain-containing protein [Sulfurimonas sp.]|uniref:GGDEF domain-containing protein n=1 Tax=Sulfurimonas sp. TaxID=2022749 RepID=UPI00356ACBF6